jgi:hypothetical protein
VIYFEILLATAALFATKSKFKVAETIRSGMEQFCSQIRII